MVKPKRIYYHEIKVDHFVSNAGGGFVWIITESYQTLCIDYGYLSHEIIMN